MAMKRYVVLALFLSACATVKHNSPDAEALMNADRVFARDSLARGGPAWEAAFAPNASKPNPDGSWTSGNKAIGEQMGNVFSKGVKLEWDPVRAEMTKGGRLGYTRGRYTLTLPDGKTRTGMYITVWQKQKDGSWKAIFDDGDGDEPSS